MTLPVQETESKVAKLRILCRLAWNNWPDNEASRREIAAHEARDKISADAWDRVVSVIQKSTDWAGAAHNSGERGPSVMADFQSADPTSRDWLCAVTIERCAVECDRLGDEIMERAEVAHEDEDYDEYECLECSAVEYSRCASAIRALVAQRREQGSSKPEVAGSIPAERALLKAEGNQP